MLSACAEGAVETRTFVVTLMKNRSKRGTLIYTFAAIAGEKRVLGHWPLSALALTVGEGDSDLVTSDVESFRRQELFFALLNLPQIGALLALQAISKFVRGRPSAPVIWILAIGLLLQSIHLGWFYQRRASLSLREQRISTFWSLGINSALALLLTFMTIRGDTAYYALMLLPVLEAAFRLGLGATIAVAILADFICFFGAYGGDLVLRINEPELVCFSIEIPAHSLK
jgi:hypothetical protein